MGRDSLLFAIKGPKKMLGVILLFALLTAGVMFGTILLSKFLLQYFGLFEPNVFQFIGPAEGIAITALSLFVFECWKAREIDKLHKSHAYQKLLTEVHEITKDIDVLK